MGGAYFGWVDYLVFGGMMLFSLLIGVYFAFFAKRKQNTRSEYLVGGKSMGIFPISMSLISSLMSGITLLGLTADVFVYGSQYCVIAVSQMLVCLAMAEVYLPVFYKLQLPSSYEYLQLRFNQPVRLLGTIFFIIRMFIHMPICIYIPALAFHQVTGISVHLVTPVVSLVCIFYTSMGGLKAVVWTDTLQAILMFGGILMVMVQGIIKVGGVSEVYTRSRESDRLEFFNLDPDPRKRHTFWTLLIGGFFYWLGDTAISQAMAQRSLAMSSFKRVKITVLILSFGFLFVTLSCSITGLIIYTYYAQCDPVATKMISKADEIVPYFVMQISDNIPGFPGLFIASVFSAALSSMSTGICSLNVIVFEDLIRPMVKQPISDARASTIMKFMAILIGLICVALVFLVEKLGTMILAAVVSCISVVYGPLLGMFSLGMICPWANSKGAFVGGITSFIITSWISIGSQLNYSRGLITFPKKMISIEGCTSDVFNSTVLPIYIPTDEGVFWLYRVSYMYYTLIGVILTIIIGLAVSFMTGPRDIKDINRDLLTPVIHRFLPPIHEYTSEELDELQPNQKLIKNI